MARVVLSAYVKVLYSRRKLEKIILTNLGAVLPSDRLHESRGYYAKHLCASETLEIIFPNVSAMLPSDKVHSVNQVVITQRDLCASETLEIVFTNVIAMLPSDKVHSVNQVVITQRDLCDSESLEIVFTNVSAVLPSDKLHSVNQVVITKRIYVTRKLLRSSVPRSHMMSFVQGIKWLVMQF